MVFDFTNWNIGVCFALDQIEVGRSSNRYNMTLAKVVALNGLILFSVQHSKPEIPFKM